MQSRRSQWNIHARAHALRRPEISRGKNRFNRRANIEVGLCIAHRASSSCYPVTACQLLYQHHPRHPWRACSGTSSTSVGLMIMHHVHLQRGATLYILIQRRHKGVESSRNCRSRKSQASPKTSNTFAHLRILFPYNFFSATPSCGGGSEHAFQYTFCVLYPLLSAYPFAFHGGTMLRREDVHP